jgi:hypothetical protein
LSQANNLRAGSLSQGRATCTMESSGYYPAPADGLSTDIPKTSSKSAERSSKFNGCM